MGQTINKLCRDSSDNLAKVTVPATFTKQFSKSRCAKSLPQCIFDNEMKRYFDMLRKNIHTHIFYNLLVKLLLRLWMMKEAKYTPS